MDFSSTGILEFIPTKGWSEDQKVSFSLKFVELFLVFLTKSLDEKLTDQADEKLQALIKTNPSEQEVVDFYNQLFPNLAETINNKAIEFKKIFLLKLYQDKLAIVEKLNDDTVYKNWEKINERAGSDKWDEVLELVGQLTA